MSRILLLLLLFSLTSCAVRFGKMKAVDSPASVLPNFIFEGRMEMRFNFEMEYREKMNSAILIVVRDSISIENFRAIVLAKTGFEMLDLSFSSEGMEVNSILPFLDRNIFLQTFEDDMRMIFDNSEFISLGFYSVGDRLLERRKRAGKIEYVERDRNGNIKRIFRGKKKSYSKYLEIHSENLSSNTLCASVVHCNLPLSMTITSLDN